MFDITNPIYTDADKAREHLESIHWPHGPICPHCGNINPDRITKLQGKSTRPGVYKCNECSKPFSVTVGTVFERSHIPLNKWVLASHLIAASKKGMSAHQLHRMLGVTYKTAWFMAHRIREAMKEDVKSSGPIGGEAHLHRYLAEFDFRYNRRAALKISDAERAEDLLRMARDKRLTYRRIGDASYA